MDTKDQSVSVLRRFLADMKRLGFSVHCIQTDRDSEFFEQEGEASPSLMQDVIFMILIFSAISAISCM